MTMLRVLAASMLFPCLLLARVPREPAAGPPVAQGADEKAVLATIDALFANDAFNDRLRAIAHTRSRNAPARPADEPPRRS